MSYPKPIGKTIPTLHWKNNPIFKVEANLGDTSEEGTIYFTYNFSTGDLLSVDRYTGKCTRFNKTREAFPVVLYGVNVTEDQFHAISKDLSEKASIGRSAMEANKKHKTKETADVYNKVLGPWQAAIKTKEDSFTKIDKSNEKEIGTYKRTEMEDIADDIRQIIVQPGGPWAVATTEKEKPAKPKKAKPIPWTAHCRFYVYIKDTESKKEAMEVFRHCNMVVKGKYDSNATNWRGISHLPPRLCGGKTNQWYIPIYIKVFFEAIDVGGARKKLDEMYPSVTTCWDNGIEKAEEKQICSTDDWSFSIKPSTEEDAKFENRYHPRWPWNRVWQRQQDIDPKDEIFSSDTKDVAIKKALSQYNSPEANKIGLTAWELTYILNSHGIDTGTEGIQRLSEETILGVEGVKISETQSEDEAIYIVN